MGEAQILINLLQIIKGVDQAPKMLVKRTPILTLMHHLLKIWLMMILMMGMKTNRLGKKSWKRIRKNLLGQTKAEKQDQILRKGEDPEFHQEDQYLAMKRYL